MLLPDYSHLSTEDKAREYIKCKNNIFYFIFNYVYIPEIGGSLKWTSDLMHPKVKCTIRSAIKFNKIMFMATRQLGKALSIHTPIPLSDGKIIRLADLKIGDEVIGRDGKGTKVTFITETMHDHICYKLDFDYANSIVADKDHLWSVIINSEEKIYTTDELISVPPGTKIYIKNSSPINYNIENYISSNSYLAGIFSSRLSVSYDLTPSELIDFDLSSFYSSDFNYHININKYFKSSIENRLLFISGLMDGAGKITNGEYIFSHADCLVLNQLKHLLGSLGIKSKIHYTCTTVPSIRFKTTLPIFKLNRKKILADGLFTDFDNYHEIIRISKVQSIPVKCIQVDNQDKLFLCGDFVPTHNSTTAAVLIEYMMNFYPRNRAIIINMKKPAALENLSKIKFIHEMLPDFLKPTLISSKLNDRKTYLEYENGSRVDTFYPSTSSGPEHIARSMTSPILYIDEAAFINHIQNAYGAAQPVLSRARIQAKKHGYPTLLMVTSTPNGVEGDGKFFHDMWGRSVPSDDLFDEEANLTSNYEKILGDPSKNGFVSIKYHWSEIYDEKWYAEQVRELNFDRRRINQELDLIFVGGTNCIFDDDFLGALTPTSHIHILRLPHTYKLKIYKEFQANDFYLIGVDSAKSLVGDFCAIEIFQYSNFEQVAEFNARIGSLTKYAEIIKHVIQYVYSQVGVRICVGIENNSMGVAIVEALTEDTEFDYVRFLYREDSKTKTQKDYGIATTPKSKDKMISLFYDNVTSDPLLIHSTELISQLSIIEKNYMGSISAQRGQHDDLFMAACFCALIKKDKQFEIEPLISVNSATYYKQQEDLIQKIIELSPKNQDFQISNYFNDAEIDRINFPTEVPDYIDNTDISGIPFPEMF